MRLVTFFLLGSHPKFDSFHSHISNVYFWIYFVASFQLAFDKAFTFFIPTIIWQNIFYLFYTHNLTNIFYLVYTHNNFVHFQCAKPESGRITSAFLFYFPLIFNTNFSSSFSTCSTGIPETIYSGCKPIALSYNYYMLLLWDSQLIPLP